MPYRSKYFRMLLLPVVITATLWGQVDVASATGTPSTDDSKQEIVATDQKKSDDVKSADSDTKSDDVKSDDKESKEAVKSDDKSENSSDDKGKSDNKSDDNGKSEDKVRGDQVAQPVTAVACTGTTAVKSVEYKVNGTTVADLRGSTSEGAKVDVSFAIADGCEDVKVGLAAYTAPGSQFDLVRLNEQKLFAHQSGTFSDDGQTRTLSITNATCNYQVDFFTGPVRQQLSATENYNNPVPNLISADNGGTKACTTVDTPPVNVDECPAEVTKRVVRYDYTINGQQNFANLSTVKPGDTVRVDFVIAAGCDTEQMSLVAYEAPSAVFSRSTADQQVLFQSQTGEFKSGVHNMTVTAPACFFQIDFVRGGVIQKLGPEGTNNFYSDQGRLIDYQNGGTACSTPVTTTPPTSIAPTVVTTTPVAGAEVLGEVVLAAPAAAPAEAPAQVLGESLARTGTDTTDMLLMGLALLLMGGALMAAARARRLV